MNITFIIAFSILLLTIAAPFIALYAVSFIKKKDYKTHMKIQKRLYWVCIVALVVLEVQIRIAGSSGGMVAESVYIKAPFFKYLLIAHIIGAVLTYIFWSISIFKATKNAKKLKTLPGAFSFTHKKMGITTIIGLFYTAITALLVFTLAFL